MPHRAVFRAFSFCLVATALAVTAGCARFQNLNWSAETVKITDLAENEYTMRIYGNGFTTTEDLQYRATVEAAKLCGEGRYAFRNEAGNVYEDWSSFGATGVVVSKAGMTIEVICQPGEEDADAETRDTSSEAS